MAWDDETVRDAVDVLQDLVLWEMSAQRWEHVEATLHRIERALADGDAAELREAVAELEVSGPVRILRIGTRTTTGIPPRTLDRRNALVHALTTARTAEDERGRQPR
ncbi:CATRA system-associated protein [Actinoplanes sp. URMC 104]|uniref:CATRA system-associated protein n=1 Tax=Actinoplanes sp. URMC 104 TaxID=3423409 RepID=UPI003F1D1FBC